MSYRNPKIITPPNYGEIFARNMQYGAALVRSVAEPLLAKIKKQKDAIKFSKTAMFGTEVKIDDSVDTGDADVDDVLQEYLMGTASGLAVISKKAFTGEDGVTQLDFNRAERSKIKQANRLNNIFERILNTKTTLEPRRGNLSMHQTENQQGFLGILDALDDIKKSGFYLVEDPETGETKIGHIKAFDKLKEGEEGQFVSYSLDKLEEMMEAGLSFREDFFQKSNPKNNEDPTIRDILDLAVNTASGKSKDFFTEQQYGKIVPLNITESIENIYGDEVDINGRLIPNGKRFGKYATRITTREVQNYDDFVNTTKAVLNNNLSADKLDKIFDDNIIGRVKTNPVTIKDAQGKDVEISANAIYVAKNLAATYGLASDEASIYKLALDITSGRTNQKDEEYIKKVTSVADSSINTKYASATYKAGQEFDLAKIVHEYTLNHLTKKAVENTLYNPDLEGFNFSTVKPKKINVGAIKDGKEAPKPKDTTPSNTQMQLARAQYNRLINTRNTLEDFNKYAFESENAFDSGRLLIDLTPENINATEQYLKNNLGLEMSAAVNKDGSRKDYRINDNGEYSGIFTFNKDAIAKGAKGVSYDIEIINGKTTLFDIYERIYALEGIYDTDNSNITASELEATYLKSPEDFDFFIQEINKKYNLYTTLGL